MSVHDDDRIGWEMRALQMGKTGRRCVRACVICKLIGGLIVLDRLMRVK